MSNKTADDAVWATSQRTWNTRPLSKWPYKDRFGRRVGRRQATRQEGGWGGDSAPPLSWEWSQQGCELGHSSTGEASKAPPPQALVGPKPAVLLTAIATSTGTALLPASCRAHPHCPAWHWEPPPQDRPLLILLSTLPTPGPNWDAVKACWVEE